MLRRKLGIFGETITQRYFEKNGYTLWKKNVREREGEIDLVLMHPNKRLLVCVEVKLRSSFESGYPEDAYDFRKRRKIYRLAEKIRQQHFPFCSLQLDLVCIFYDQKAGEVYLKHWPARRI